MKARASLCSVHAEAGPFFDPAYHGPDLSLLAALARVLVAIRNWVGHNSRQSAICMKSSR
jgi:hypothetical protein